MNQFTHDGKSGYWDVEAHHSLRTEGRIRYGLFDFDISEMLMWATGLPGHNSSSLLACSALLLNDNR